MLYILTILLDKCQTKSFEGNELSTQSNSQVLYHQPAIQDAVLRRTPKTKVGKKDKRVKRFCNDRSIVVQIT